MRSIANEKRLKLIASNKYRVETLTGMGWECARGAWGTVKSKQSASCRQLKSLISQTHFAADALDRKGITRLVLMALTICKLPAFGSKSQSFRR